MLLPASIAVQVTSVAPFGKELPLGGTQEKATSEQLSLTPTVKVTLLLQLPGLVLTVILPGQVMLGA